MKTMREIVESGRMPTEQEYKAFYEAQANPRPGDGWTPSNQHIDTGFGRTKFALEHIKPGMSVLECGTQDGGMTIHLIRAVWGKGGHVTGIDISPTYIRRTKEYLSSYYEDMLDLHVADATTFSTRRRYHVIVAMEILEHVPEPGKLLKNLWGLLRKKGKILITVPLDWRDDLGEHIHDFTEETLRALIQDALGLEVDVWQKGPWLFAVIEK